MQKEKPPAAELHGGFFAPLEKSDMLYYNTRQLQNPLEMQLPLFVKQPFANPATGNMQHQPVLHITLFIACRIYASYCIKNKRKNAKSHLRHITRYLRRFSQIMTKHKGMFFFACYMANGEAIFSCCFKNFAKNRKCRQKAAFPERIGMKGGSCNAIVTLNHA